MKKRYILIPLVFILCTYTLINRVNIINMSYIEDNNYVIDINYPYFDNDMVDNYIDSYLSDNITSFKYENNDGILIIDYDISLVSDEINLTFYKYQKVNNLVREEIKRVSIIEDNIKDISKETVAINNNVYQSNKIDLSKKIIAFTFDDGPNYNTSKMIEVLNKYNVRATFFVMGSRIKGNEDLLVKMIDSNMEIGNHTYSHMLLTRLNEDRIKEEINKTNELIYDVTNKYPKLLRPSYGSTNNKIKKVANMPIIIWDIDPLDWKYHNSTKIANRILKKVSDGDIILMHDIYSATVKAVDIVIPELIKEGYQIVTVSELFYYKNIELKKGQVYGYAK